MNSDCDLTVGPCSCGAWHSEQDIYNLKATPIQKLQDFLDDANGIKKPEPQPLFSSTSGSLIFSSPTLSSSIILGSGTSFTSENNTTEISDPSAKAQCYFKNDPTFKIKMFKKKPNWFIRQIHYWFLGLVWKDIK